MKRKNSKPRRFEVWIDKGICGADTITEIVEMPAGSTDEECEKACASMLDTMIGNELDTGWQEIEE